MEEIELVVKISEDVYRYAKKHNGSSMLTLRDEEMGMCMDAIANGTPLPKGHGRLIDADELKNDAQTMTEWNGDVFRCVTERTIDYAPTIIETDKEG